LIKPHLREHYDLNKHKWLGRADTEENILFKYIVQEKQSNGSLIKVAVPYFGIEDAIDINPSAEMIKKRNPVRFNIMSQMKKRIAQLEALNKQLLAECGPLDKMTMIQAKLESKQGDKRYLETDQDSYLLDNGLVFQLPKKRMKNQEGNNQEGGAVTCRDECERFKDRIWREPEALAKLVKRQSKLQDRMLEDLLRN
jgi:hypothetical protein